MLRKYSIIFLTCFTFASCKSVGSDDEIESRIIYGHEASITDHPYFAEIQSTTGSCGASILSHEWLLTAAHCVEYSTHGTAYVGGETLGNSVSIPYNKVEIHPDYDGVNLMQDIALVKLSKPLIFTDKIQPIGLPTSNTEQNYPLLLVARGGNENNIPSPSLMKLALEELGSRECLRYFHPWLRYFRRMKAEDPRIICAKRAGVNGPSSCYGDSGSPVVQNNVVVGITSSGGLWDCMTSIANFYVRVACYVPWIVEVTKMH